MDVPNVEDELNKMQEHLKTRPDDKLIDGYKNAMKDYEETGRIECKLAGDCIKAEIDRRGIKVEQL